MSNEFPSDATEKNENETTDEMATPESDSGVLTRPWPEATTDEPTLSNPLGDSDFEEVFATTVEQPFPSDVDLNPKSEAGPGDTAEDPIPAG